MLRRISPKDVRLGMYIVSLEGDWLDHPFWRSGFRLTDQRDLAKLHRSYIDAVIVDDERGATLYNNLLPPSHNMNYSKNGAVSERVPRSFFRKPTHSEAYHTIQYCCRDVSRMFNSARMGRGVKVKDAASIVKDIDASLVNNPLALLALTRLKANDTYTYYHSVAVSALMIMFARYLNKSNDEIHLIGIAGLLHDIGKMTIPNSILVKPGSLTPDEIDIIRTHTVAGHSILLSQPDVPELILDVCLNHHERMDGSGYPYKLSSSDLSIYARIAAICDVYDAVTSIRPYRTAWEPVEALSRMQAWKGHFDEDLLRSFVSCMGFQDSYGALTERPLIFAYEETTTINGFSDPSAR